MEHGVMGDPFTASAEKGERLCNVLVERLSALCREYHETEPPRYREFGSHCP
jgi:creatinine amidohydrolase/Fe(II)-dependent formamide hydrolase-like protein